MKNIFKKINGEFFFLEKRDKLTQFHQKNDCVLMDIDLINYNAEKYHLILSKSKPDLHYVVEERIKENNNPLEFFLLKSRKFSSLEEHFNRSKKITIQNGKTLVIAHDTPERDKFLELIEDVNKLDSIDATVYEYEQETDVGGLGFRILPEIATYIFKDLFVVALTDGTKVNARRRNKAFIYNNALQQINKATTPSKLDGITWNFLHPAGIVIDVNAEAAEMLADPTVSQFAKNAINTAKDPTTGEIHLVKTLQELAADS